MSKSHNIPAIFKVVLIVLVILVVGDFIIDKLFNSKDNDSTQTKKDANNNYEKQVELAKTIYNKYIDAKARDAICDEFLQRLKTFSVDPYVAYKQFALQMNDSDIATLTKALIEMEANPTFSDSFINQTSNNIDNLKHSIMLYNSDDKFVLVGNTKLPNTLANQRRYMKEIHDTLYKNQLCNSATTSSIQVIIDNYYTNQEQNIHTNLYKNAVAMANKEVIANINQQLAKKNSPLKVKSIGENTLTMFTSASSKFKPEFATAYKNEKDDDLTISMVLNKGVVIVDGEYSGKHIMILLSQKHAYVDKDKLENGYYLYIGSKQYSSANVVQTVHAFMEMPKLTILEQNINGQSPNLIKNLYWYEPATDPDIPNKAMEDIAIPNTSENSKDGK